jgi:hypothetical protein
MFDRCPARVRELETVTSNQEYFRSAFAGLALKRKDKHLDDGQCPGQGSSNVRVLPSLFSAEEVLRGHQIESLDTSTGRRRTKQLHIGRLKVEMLDLEFRDTAGQPLILWIKRIPVSEDQTSNPTHLGPQNGSIVSGHWNRASFDNNTLIEVLLLKQDS